MPPILRANACRAALTVVLLSASGAAEATCKSTVPIAPVLMQQYLATPAVLLYSSPQGTDALRVQVQRLAPSGPEAIKAVLSIVADASHAQQIAIGRGLAEAALICTTQDSVIVQRIKNAVRSSGSSVVAQSFIASFEEGGGDDAAEPPPSSAGQRRSAPQTMLPDDPTNTGKLPNPFGAPDEWR